MSEFVVMVILGFLGIRVVVSLINWLSGVHLPDQQPLSYPKVSILIPARNEETTIGNLLSNLQNLDYPDFEVIVCNDHSADNTEEILNWYAGEDGRISWFLGDKLPTDWLGKNFACHQLAAKAKGEYLIFLDADVDLSKNAVTKALAFFQKKELDLLSVFPQQKMLSIAEHLTVPIMNWILQSLLPLIFVEKTRFSSIAAANGQLMMFEAINYREHQWHSKVRNQNVEDIRISRMIKGQGMKTAVLLGNRDIYCRMYRNLGEAILGFSRNIHEYFGGSRLVMTFFWLMVCFAPFNLFFFGNQVQMITFAVLVLANRLFVALASRQNVILAMLLHPFQMIGFSCIVVYNIFRGFTKNTEWKGRKIGF